MERKDAVPDIKKRRAAAESLGDCMTDLHVNSSSGKHWCTCDYIYFGQTEICLMYYTIAGMNDEIESTLSGEHPDKEDNYFYPTGRCASFLTMHTLCDKLCYITAM